MKKSVSILLAITLLLSLAGCGKSHPTRSAYASKSISSHGGTYKTGKSYQVAGRWYHPMESAEGYNETGTASWYGSKFHGRKTSNGERYDMYAMSAAHKTLPLPTMVRVTNLDNGRSVVVRVNDRGPFVKNRLIDLSYAAARQLGYDKTGTAPVHVEVIGYASSAPTAKKPASRPVPRSVHSEALSPGSMYIQLGAFSSHSNAVRMKALLQQDYPNIDIYSRNGGYSEIYRVRIGPFDKVENIESNVLTLQRRGYRDAIVVIE